MLFIAVVILYPIRILDAKGENNHNQDVWHRPWRCFVSSSLCRGDSCNEHTNYN